MAEAASEMRVQVCYVRPERQILREIRLQPGTTLGDAIMRSGLLEEAPEIDLQAWRVGIYGKLKTLDTVLRDHDRVEIYRPLLADPKEARRRRAVKSEEGKKRGR